MNQFSELLKRVSKKINLPQPMKSRILLEVSADLNDLYNHFLEQGFNEEDSKRKTEEKCNLNDETITELINVYNSGFYKWIQNISDQTRGRWEKVLLLFVVLFSFFFMSQIVLTSKFILQASIFIVPVLSIFGLAMILLIIDYYKIFIIKDHNITRLRAKLPVTLFLGGASLLAGVIGFFIDLYLTVSKISSEMEKTLLYFIEWLIRSTTHLMICLIIIIFISGIWFILYSKIIKIESAAAECLFNN